MSTQLRLRSEDLHWRVVDGDIVVLDFPAGTYFATNRSGTLLWEKLREGTSRPELVQAMLDRYEIPADQAEQEVDEFVSQLSSHGLLE